MKPAFTNDIFIDFAYTFPHISPELDYKNDDVLNEFPLVV